MDNKQEEKEFVDSVSGVTDQMVVAPVEGAGVEETKVTDPSQAEPTPGGRSEPVDDDTTDGIKGGELPLNRGLRRVEKLMTM